MPNTTIQLKKSSTPSAKPTDLANGELAINFADGKLYYKNTTSSIVEITPTQSFSFGTVSANGTLLVSDTVGDILTIAAGNNINITADALTDRLTISLSNDVIVPTGGTLKVNAVGGDEGGEIKLANAITNSGVSGDVIIDIWQNHIRFFESGGTNRGAFINLALAATGVGTNLLATSGSTDTTARTIGSAAFDKANAANVLAFNALPNTSGATFNGTLNVSSNLVADKVLTSNNGFSENFRVGDDVWIGDTNISNTIRIKGVQDSQQAYIIFNTVDTKALGRSGSGALTWDGGTIWTSLNDGASSGLDADLLDGIHASVFANNATLIGANTAVGTGANAFTSATVAGANSAVGTGANSFASATIAGANTAVGTGANSFASATIAGANAAVGTGANAFASATIAGANSFTSATITGANSAVGTGANAFASATITGANSAVGTAANSFTSATIAGANSAVGTAANSFASATIAGANSAVGTGANAFTSATIAGANSAVGTGANAFASATIAGANAFFSTTIAGANTAVGTGANAFASATVAGANSAVGTAANNFAIATFGAANNTPVGNTLSTLFTLRSTRRTLNFIPSTNITINVDDDSAGNRANITIDTTGLVTTATLTGANSAIGTGANSFASATVAGANALFTATIAGANTAVGTGANAFTSATIAGANSAVGTGANNFLLAVIAGANTTVGTGANAFASATIAGANSAVGTGANSFASATIAGANAFASATIAGANSAVGTGANNFASATIAGANSAVGTGANNFASATIAGANTAVGTAANNFAIATFGAANNTPVGNTLSSTFTSRSTRRSLNFIPGTNININVDDDSAGNRANITIDTTGLVAVATIAGANTAVGTGANAFTSATIAGANSAVGTGANAFTSATIAGANSAVGTGANNFASATIAGANSAVGTGANSFASATIAGANSAVGTAANNFAIATFGAANTRPVGNTLSTTFTSRSTRRILNFIPGSNITINVDDDSAGDRTNVTIASSASGSGASVFSANVGNASANSFNIAHNLAKTFVIPSVRENSSGYYVYPDMRYTTPNHIVLEFVNVPSTNQYTVIVIG